MVLSVIVLTFMTVGNTFWAITVYFLALFYINWLFWAIFGKFWALLRYLEIWNDGLGHCFDFNEGKTLVVSHKCSFACFLTNLCIKKAIFCGFFWCLISLSHILTKKNTRDMFLGSIQTPMQKSRDGIFF